MNYNESISSFNKSWIEESLEELNGLESYKSSSVKTCFCGLFAGQKNVKMTAIKYESN